MAWKEKARIEIQPENDQEDVFNSFCEYWTAHNSTDKKFNAEKQSQFYFKRRFLTWYANTINSLKTPPRALKVGLIAIMIVE